MIIGFIIWSMVAVIFLFIGMSARNSKQEVGFFTFSGPPKMKDVIAYNRAVGRLWFFFSAFLEIIGVPMLFIEQNSPVFIAMIFATLILVGVIVGIYLKIENKYKEK